MLLPWNLHLLPEYNNVVVSIGKDYLRTQNDQIWGHFLFPFSYSFWRHTEEGIGNVSLWLSSYFLQKASPPGGLSPPTSLELIFFRGWWLFGGKEEKKPHRFHPQTVNFHVKVLSLEMTVLRNTKLFFSCATSVVLSAGGTLGQPILSQVSLPPTCGDAVPGPHRSHCASPHQSHQAAKLHLLTTGRQHFLYETYVVLFWYFWWKTCFVEIHL